MYHRGHPDGNYQTVSKVAVLDPPRAIGWLTGQELGDGPLEFGGWLWRYDLAPLGPSGTDVTLTYDLVRSISTGLSPFPACCCMDHVPRQKFDWPEGTATALPNTGQRGGCRCRRGSSMR